MSAHAKGTHDISSMSEDQKGHGKKKHRHFNGHRKKHSKHDNGAETSEGAHSPRRRQSSCSLNSVIDDSNFHLPYALPRGPCENGHHSCCMFEAEKYEVRGKTYMQDKVKIPSKSALFEFVHADLFTTSQVVNNVALRRDSYLQQARDVGDDRFYMVVVYQCPSKPMVHLVLYYALSEEVLHSDATFQKIWSQFTADTPEAEAFRNERWKVIPNIPEGSWIVKRAVGTKPALLATKLTHHWQLHNNHMEVDCDVTSSSMASALTSLLSSYAKNIVIDIAFTIEGQNEAELPERVLSGVRLSRIDLSIAPNFAE